MFIKSVCFQFLVSATLFSGLVGNEADFLSKINSLITIGDTVGARKVTQFTLELYPNSKSVLPMLVRTLADDGYLKEAVRLLPPISSDEEVKQYFSLLESIGWNYLNHEEGISTISNIASLLGAYKTHDARCVALLLKKLNSTNAFDRHLAVKLAITYRDLPLKRKIVQMLKDEKNYFVKKMLIEACGKMQIKESAKILNQLIASNTLTFEQRWEAILALINIRDKPTTKEIVAFKNSARTSVRELCVALISHFELKEHGDILIDFLRDRHPSVRAKALITLLMLSIDVSLYSGATETIEKIVKEDVCEVSEIAKLALMTVNLDKAKEAIRTGLLGTDLKRARFCARVIGYGGEKLHEIILEAFKNTKDSLTKANLAISMIGKNINDLLLVNYLAKFLESYDGKLMMKTNYSPFFIGIDKSNIKHIPYVNNYPNLVDSMARLHLLSKLAIINSDAVRDSMKKFLKNKMWGVASSAAIVMLEDCRLEELSLLETLLEDSDPNVQLQAALVLAFYGGDPSVSILLENIYKEVNWEKKVMILEAIGAIGNRKSIPFLIERIKRESFYMQKISAASMLQCLYH